MSIEPGTRPVPLSSEELCRQREALDRTWQAAGYYQGRTLHEAIVEGVVRFADTVSIFNADGEDRAYDNAEMHRAALAVASALNGIGISEGDVVAVQLPTWYETALLFQAIAHVGAVALPILTIFGTREVRFILEQSRAKAIFMPARLRSMRYIERLTEIAAIPSIQAAYFLGSSDDAVPSERSWPDFLSKASGTFPASRAAPGDVALIMYTSGTTGNPKGVQHTHNTLLREWGRPAYVENRRLFLSNLPAGHYSGYQFLMRPAIYGVPSVFMEQWEARTAARLVERYQVRQGGGTPVFLLSLLQAAAEIDADLGSLETFSMGGQGMTPSLIAKTDAAGFPGARVYGLTEHPTVTALDPDASFEKRGHTDGRADEGNEIRILDDAGLEVSAGAEGEIVVRGPEMFIGYLDPAANLDCFLPGVWFRTGDIGKLDADGYLIVTDRKKDIIIRGGENISSIEVEGILLEHPDILEAAVVAMPDVRYGERVCAFVVPRGGRHLTLDDLKAHFAAAGVARQKTPEWLEIAETLPRNSSGKVLKAGLREQARAIGERAPPPVPPSAP